MIRQGIQRVRNLEWDPGTSTGTRDRRREMSDRPKCELGHELDFIGHNHVDPDQLREHADPNDAESMASIEHTILLRKAYIKAFWDEREAGK